MLPLSGSLHCSAIFSFVQVDVSLFRSFGAAYEGSVLRVYVKALYSYVHTYLLGFVFRTNPRGIPASIDSSAQNLAENHSGIVRKIDLTMGVSYKHHFFLSWWPDTQASV